MLIARFINHLLYNAGMSVLRLAEMITMLTYSNRTHRSWCRLIIVFQRAHHVYRQPSPFMSAATDVVAVWAGITERLIG